MIILEGPDGAGKSTLIAEIEKHLGIKATHFGGPPKTKKEMLIRIQNSFDCQLLDRWSPISEQIYGPLRPDSIGVSTNLLNNFIDQTKPIIVYCRPHRNTLMRNKVEGLKREKQHKSREHCEAVSRNFNTIIQAYDKLMSNLLLRGHSILTYDYEAEDNLENLLEKLREQITSNL